MQQRNAIKVFGTLDNFLSKYRVDLEQGKIYSLRTGKEVCYLNKRGYYCYVTKLKQKCIRINRSHLIFWAGKGYLPPIHMDIDHIDGNTSNDSIHNLQELTGSQNQLKRQLNSRKNGYYGVRRDKQSYRAEIRIKEKVYYFKKSKNIKIAAIHRDMGVIKLFWKSYLKDGFMPPLNFPELLQKYAKEMNDKKHMGQMEFDFAQNSALNRK
jgi:hypothetical protein